MYSRKIFEKDSVVRKNDWKKITSYTLAERTIGIVGLGYVGKEVARKASAFGMKVYFTDILDVDLEDNLNYDEPWGWMIPTRHAYAALK